MTQSGQGEPAREGIVLPSDGGEPLLPGMTGGPPAHPAAPVGQPPAAAPSGGQAWGQPWGPDQQQPQSQPGEGWPPAAAQGWGTPEQPAAWQHQDAGAPAAAPLPPEGPPPAVPYGGQAPQLPGYGAGADAGQASYGQGAVDPRQPYGADGTPAAAPLPPAAPGAPLPAAAPDGATQYLPQGAAAPDGATQYLPPVSTAAAGDDGATQYIPPVGPGALPPETSAEATQFLGHAAPPQPAAHSDAEATQYMPPVSDPYGGERQPPAEFDNLFRGGGEGQGSAGATQQMPHVQPQHGYGAQSQPSYAPAQPSYSPAGGGRAASRGGGGTGSRVPLIAAVGVGIVVLGIGVGALLSDGGDEGKDHGNKTVAASGPAADPSASAAADPAREQAVALDKLLADSGSSRASVIKSVADVKSCQNLQGAAAALHDAAQQRSGLVNDLSKLTVDKLPDHAALTGALAKAWQASAAADNHYAAWAGQIGGKHGCKKGQARSTPQRQAGDRESGIASSQKVEAARLWNSIAKQYGLTQRGPTQL
ncbi:hypothetical protein [Streptomyces sp. NPDC046805]|uniref:hypothetical protein n=1 Tax=Streptomyces sp. NPDC046805 TaxID=3155134 RepID=UPI0033EA63C4